MDPFHSETPPDIPKNPFRILTPKDWLYLPHLLSRKERALLVFFTALALFGGVAGGMGILSRFMHEAPARGGTYREGMIRPPERINPLFLSNNDTDRDLVNLMYAKLFAYSPSGALMPDLAESYLISDDSKTYTIELKKNARWHDGGRVTADDVIFTIRAIQNPDYKSSLRPNWQGVSVERLGDYTVRLILKQPYSPFIQNLALPILPQHIWARIPAENASMAETNIRPVGSGPFVFKSLERDGEGVITKYRLSANQRYHSEGPYIQSVEFSFYDDEQSLMQAYIAGKIDGISVVSAKSLERLKNLGASIYAIKMPRVFAVFLNESAPVLKDKDVRRALALAVPKEELIKNVLGGGAVPIDSPIPPGIFGFNPELEKIAYDPAAAQKLLDRAGWKDLNGDGIREKKSAKKSEKPAELSFTVMTSDWKDLKGTAEALSAYWKKIGVKAEVHSMPVSNLETSVIRPRKYDALLFGEILGRDPDPFSFWHSSQLKDPGLNIALYHSPRVDLLLEQARKTTSRDEIEDKYFKFQAVIAEDFPTIFLYSPLYYYTQRPWIRGAGMETITVPSERFENASRWYIETKRVFGNKR